MSFSFGQPAQQQQQPSTSLFGSSTAAKPLFGGFSTPNLQQQGSISALGTSLFGQSNPAQNPSAGGSLFGQSQNQQGSSGLFGGQQQPQPQQTGGGMFGGGGGTGLFGATTTATAAGQGQPASGGGGLFGSTTQQQPQAGSLFGQPQQQQPNAGGLFGASSTAPSGGSGLFGQPKPGGLFGTTTQQPPQQQGGSTSSLFGGLGQSQQQQPGGLFGSTSQPAQQLQQPQLFGTMSQQTQQQQPSQQLQVGAKQEVGIEERMVGVKNAWDPSHPDCRFKYFFYNVVEPSTVGQYGRPQQVRDDKLWEKAVRENPDPSCMVPVLATGWADVKKRVALQEQLASVHQARIKEITSALSTLSRQTSLSSSLRLQALQQHLQTLLHRLIHLAALTPQLIPILQSTAFRPEEAEVARRLEGVKSELEGRGGKRTGSGASKAGAATEGRMIGQVNELWGAVEELRRRRRGGRGAGSAGGGGGGAEWTQDEKALAEVAEILATQQMALQRLTEVVNAGLFDADVMRQGLSKLER